MLRHNQRTVPKKEMVRGLSIFPLFFSSLLIILAGCVATPDFLGGDLLPEDDFLSVRTDTSFTLSVYTKTNDTLYSGNLSEIVLGSVYDPVFGRTKASCITQLAVSSLGYKVGESPRVDSVVFTLKRTGSYGENTPIFVTIHPLTDSLILSNSYNNLANYDSIYSSDDVIGSKVYRGESELKMYLSNDWAQELVSTFDSTTLLSHSNLLKKLNGIYITTSELTRYGKAIYYFNLSSNYATVEFFYNDTHSFKLHLNPEFVRVEDGVNRITKGFNIFQHDHSVGNPELGIRHLNDFTTQDSVFYIQGLGGLSGLVRLDGIVDWAKRMPIVINRAELRIPLEDSPSLPKDSLLTNISILKRVPSGFSQIEGSNVDGKLYKNKGYYSANITTHLQSLLSNSELERPEIFIKPSTPMKANRAVLRSPKHSNPMQLIITYTQLQE